MGSLPTSSCIFSLFPVLFYQKPTLNKYSFSQGPSDKKRGRDVSGRPLLEESINKKGSYIFAMGSIFVTSADPQKEGQRHIRKASVQNTACVSIRQTIKEYLRLVKAMPYWYHTQFQ